MEEWLKEHALLAVIVSFLVPTVLASLDKLVTWLRKKAKASEHFEWDDILVEYILIPIINVIKKALSVFKKNGAPKIKKKAKEVKEENIDDIL